MSDKLDNIYKNRLTSIEAQITLAMFFIAALVSLVIFIYIPKQLDIMASDIIYKEVSSLSKTVSSLMGPSVEHKDKPAIERDVKVLGRNWNISYAVVLDIEGNLLYSYNIEQAIRLNYAQSENTGPNEQIRPIYSFNAPILADNHHVGILYLGISTNQILGQLNQFRDNAAGLGIIFILLTILSTIVIRNIIGTPIRKLRETIEKITDGDISRRCEFARNGDFGKLSDSFNRMMNSWQIAQQQWGILNKDLEQRVDERTQELKDEINERKKAEEDLRLLMAKLERSNRELEDFAFVASHDLQEPLRKVQAFGDRLKAACGDELSDQARNYLERMQAAAGRMQILIKDLLTFSRVASKAQPFVQVDMNQIADEVLSDLEVTIENLSAKVEVGHLGQIEADPLQMRQLIQNLVGNALKFHKKDQTPVIRIYSDISESRPVGTNLEQEALHFIIEDNGIGFEQKYAERIFTVFQRLHGRSEYDGTGLGLAVCRKIVERHGGIIEALGEPDKGAKFFVTLPATQKPKEEIESVAAGEKPVKEIKPDNKDRIRKMEGMETSFMVPCP